MSEICGPNEAVDQLSQKRLEVKAKLPRQLVIKFKGEARWR